MSDIISLLANRRAYIGEWGAYNLGGFNVGFLRYSRERPGFFSFQGFSDETKTDSTFPVLCVRFVDFAVQFCFRCKFSFHVKRRSSHA